MTTPDCLRLARQHGITPAPAQTLFSVLGNFPATHKQLAIDCGVTSSAITGLVDKLVAGGWVERRKKPHDRRGEHVWPTDAALAIFSNQKPTT